MIAEDKLTPGRRLWIGAFAMAMAALGFAGGRILLRPSRSVVQPVRFNHRLHVDDVGLDCVTCHPYAETGKHSGLPTAAACLDCHEGGVTDSPEEQRLLELAAAGSTDLFRKLFRLPDHVYYSHREHVGLAGIECETCHGAIAGTTAPPATPLVTITMNTCVSCHVERGARTDCTPCHH